MKKHAFLMLAMAVFVVALSVAPTASAVFYTCEECGHPSPGKCIARSGPCQGFVVTCFEWFTLCTGQPLSPPEGSFESEEAFLLSLAVQAAEEQPAEAPPAESTL